MMKYFLSLLFFACTFLYIPYANAIVDVDVNQGYIKKYTFSFVPFFAQNALPANIKEVGQIIQWDLLSSGYFKYISNQNDHNITQAKNRPSIALWNNAHVQFLILGSVNVHRVPSIIKPSKSTDNKHPKPIPVTLSNTFYNINIYVWDIERGSLLFQKTYTIENLFTLNVHGISNDIFQTITGESGFFDSKITFVEHDTSGYKLGIMDQNGHNIRYLMQSPFYLLGPYFSKDSTGLAFVYRYNKIPQIMIMNLISGKAHPIQTKGLLSITPAFGTQGKFLFFSRIVSEYSGNTDVYRYNLVTKKEKRLTYDDGIDIDSVMSPNGKKIIFISDRSGKPNIYSMSVNGSHVQRLSFKGGRYFSCRWSHNGKWIVFSKNKNGKFSIGIMNRDGSNEHTIVPFSYAKKLNPVFGPLDKVVLFIQQNNNTQAFYKVHLGLGSQNKKNIWRLPLHKNIVMGDWSEKFLQSE